MIFQTILSIAKKADASAASTREALASIDISALERKVADLERKRRDALLDDDGKAIERVENELRQANLAVERAEAAKARLEERLAAAEDEEREEGRRARYDAANRASGAAQKRLAEYQKHAAAIVQILADLARAELEVAAVNADLPAGAEPILSPEIAVRALPAVAEEIVSTKTADEWHYAHPHEGWGAVGRDDVKNIETTDGRTGLLRVSKQTVVDIYHVRKCRVRRQTFLPAQGAVLPDHLASSITLPGLRVDDPPAWEPAGRGKLFGPPSASAADVLAAAERLRSSSPRKDLRPARRPETRVEVVSDAVPRSGGD